MVGEHIKYLLAVLNSKLIHWYFLTCTGTTSGVGTNRWLKYTVETIPVPKISEAAIDEITSAIDELLLCKKTGADASALEEKIDNLVIQAYGLTSTEAAFILAHE